MSDLISRQAAIDAVCLNNFHDITLVNGKPYTRGYRDGVLEKENDCIENIMNLPSAQPERKGKWIEMGTNKDGTHSIRCSKCGGGYKTRGHARSIATKAKYKFCPNCGAKMKGDAE